MKKKFLIVALILCLLVGCGKKEEEKDIPNSNNVPDKTEQNASNDNSSNDDTNLLDPSDVLGEVQSAKLGAAQNTAYALKNTTEMFYVTELMVNGEFEKTTFICNGKECSNGTETLDIHGDIPTSGEITIDVDGTTVFSNIVINGYKCDINNNDVTCSK